MKTENLRERQTAQRVNHQRQLQNYWVSVPARWSGCGRSIDHGDSETVDAVKNGEMSVNKGYEETQKKRKAAKAAEKSLKAPSPDSANTSPDSPPAVPAPNEEETVVSEDAESEPMNDMTVTLAPEHYRALKDLGESIEYHVELAIDIYLRMVADTLEEKR